MNITLQIDPQAIPRIQRKLQGISNSKIIAAAMFVGGNTVRTIMQAYPPESHRPQPFKTDKQRRYVMWAIKKGLIQIPYRRGQSPKSEDMKHRWIVRNVAGGVEIANNASYAKLVHGWQTQATYHKATGWITDQAALRDNKDKIIKDISTAYIIAVEHIWSSQQ